MGFGESGGIIKVSSEKDMPTLHSPGIPNARYDLVKSANVVKQSRWTDPNGYPIRDKDYNHSDNETHNFPHYHDWKDGERGNGYIINGHGEIQYFA